MSSKFNSGRKYNHEPHCTVVQSNGHEESDTYTEEDCGNAYKSNS